MARTMSLSRMPALQAVESRSTLAMRTPPVPPCRGVQEFFEVLHGLEGDADVAAADFFVVEDGGDDILGDIDGDGEAEVVALRDAAGVDADDFAAEVDQRPAGVAGVDGGVGLDPVIEPAGFVAADVGFIDVAFGIGDDAGGDGAREAVGGAKGHDGLADGDFGGVAQRGPLEGEFAGFEFIHIELEDGEVGPVVGADEFGFDMFAVGEGDVDEGAGDAFPEESTVFLARRPATWKLVRT